VNVHEVINESDIVDCVMWHCVTLVHCRHGLEHCVTHERTSVSQPRHVTDCTQLVLSRTWHLLTTDCRVTWPSLHHSSAAVVRPNQIMFIEFLQPW